MKNGNNLDVNYLLPIKPSQPIKMYASEYITALVWVYGGSYDKYVGAVIDHLQEIKNNNFILLCK